MRAHITAWESSRVSGSYLAVAHRRVVVAVCAQHIEESLLQARAGGLPESDVVWKCSVEVWKDGGKSSFRHKRDLLLRKAGPAARLATCADGLQQFGVTVGSEQGLVVSRVLVQLVLSPAGRHPDQRPVLVGNSLAHVPFHWRRRG